MNRTWKLLCLPALLTLALTASSVRAADPELDKSDAKKKSTTRLLISPLRAGQ